MAIVVKTPEEAVHGTVTALGLDSDTLDLTSPEVLAELIRRTASFLCPTTSRRLVDTVVEAVQVLVGPSCGLRQMCRRVIETLVGCGDLVELAAEPTDHRVRQLYLGTPTFVPISASGWVVTGVKPEGRPLLTEELQSRIQPERHVRRVDIEGLNNPESLAAASDLHRVSLGHYIQQPGYTSAAALICRYTSQLSTAPLGNPDSLRLIDPSTSPRYYRRRWKHYAPTDSGRFVARRPQAYGSDIWCYVGVDPNGLTRVLDLPILDPIASGYDEAWRLQAAIDAQRGRPQVMVVDSAPDNRVVIRFLSPIPSWAQRRLDTVGTPLLDQVGSFMSYHLCDRQYETELGVFKNLLWLDLIDLRSSDALNDE